MERHELDGLTVLFEPGPEPAMASLTFRSGVADEPAHLRGVTHLVEHLALDRIGRAAYDFNGSLDLLMCSFFARGGQDELDGFLTEVIRGLCDPPLDRLETEKQILAREADRDTGDVVSRLLAHRFGSRSFGVSSLVELGLRWVEAEHLLAWRDRRFTTGNAVLWVHGPRPPQLGASLPRGERHAPPPSDPLPGLRFPAWVAQGYGGVAAALVAERSWATTIALSLVHDALTERLRGARGISYDVWTDYAPLSAREAHVTIGADCRDEDAEEVAREILAALDELAEHGPAAEEVARERARVARGIREDPDLARRNLERLAYDELLGGGRVPLEDDVARVEAIAPDDVAAGLRASRDSLLVLVPTGGGRPREDLADLERPPADVPGGRRFKAKGLRRGDELRIGPAGVAWSSGETAVTVPAHEIALVTEGGAGELIVSGVDGSWIEVQPADLAEPDAAADAIRALAPGPIVPSGDRRAAWVRRLRDEKLNRAWTVKSELALLPGILYEGEEPLTLAEAALGMRLGLLAVTPYRLLFLYDRPVIRVPLEEVTAVRARTRLLSRRLEVTVEGETLVFSDVRPRARLPEIVDLVRERSGAA